MRAAAGRGAGYTGRVGFQGTARDDPFIDPVPFEEITPPEGVTVRLTQRGGHVGFIGWTGRWAERVAAEWLIAGGAQ